MNRTGFTASPLKAQVTSSSKKLFLIRLPKGTDLNILDGVEFDVTKGKVDNIYKDEESEYNCYMDPNVSRDFVRPLVCKSSSDSLSVGSKLEGTFTITRKFTPPPRIEANVLELYREIEQKRGLRIRVLPVGSTTILKDLVNANRDAHVRQQSLARASSGHNKRPSVEITDAASSPNSTTKEKKKKKKNDDEYGDRDDKKSKKKKTEHVP